jgi:hypothetical protein
MRPDKSGEQKKEFKFVDISGVGNAGKSAVVDFLRELDGFYVPGPMTEFDFFRIPGGLLDLEHHLVEDWSPIRADRAIKEFRTVAHRMGIDPRWYQVAGMLTASGQRYDRQFNGKFVELVDEFCDSLVEGEFKAQWYFDWITRSPLLVGWYKLLAKSGSKEWIRTPVYISSPSRALFSERVSRLINRLFSEAVPAGTTHVSFNNAFEPFNPERSLNLLQNSKIIVVYRDPRDVYVSGLNSGRVMGADRSLQSSENDGVNKSFLGTDDIDVFILRYQKMMENLYRKPDSRCLLLRFEDWVTRNEHWKPQIYDFLEVAPSAHRRPRQSFNPERSKENIGLWKRYSEQKEIDYLSRKLRDYVWT